MKVTKLTGFKKALNAEAKLNAAKEKARKKGENPTKSLGESVGKSEESDSKFRSMLTFFVQQTEFEGKCDTPKCVRMLRGKSMVRNLDPK